MDGGFIDCGADGAEALALLNPPPLGDPPTTVQPRGDQQATGLLDARTAELTGFAERRAQTLLADHRRVREAAGARGTYSVKALGYPRRDRPFRSPSEGRVAVVATRRPRRAKESQLTFEALSIEGGLLSPEWLARVAALGAEGQSEAEYRVPRGLNLRDEIGRYWRMAQAQWKDFHTALSGDADRRVVSERFVLPLLRDVLGFASLTAVTPIHLGGRSYPIGFLAIGKRVPVIIAPAAADLDDPSPLFGDGGRRRTAFGSSRSSSMPATTRSGASRATASCCESHATTQASRVRRESKPTLLESSGKSGTLSSPRYGCSFTRRASGAPTSHRLTVPWSCGGTPVEFKGAVRSETYAAV